MTVRSPVMPDMTTVPDPRGVPRRVLVALVLVAVTLIAASTINGAANAHARHGSAAPSVVAPATPIRGAGLAGTVRNSYLVVLKGSLIDKDVGARVRRLAAYQGATVNAVYRWALHGFAATMTEQAAQRLAANPAVAYVEQDRIFSIASDQANPPSWGLDRVDERKLPLDSNYKYDATAPSVRAYIIDTGIRITHDEFGTRASYGRDTVNEDNDASDCNGHGTHVAGTVGGSTYGVAKNVRLVGVKVLNCGGRGTTGNIVQGVDWVTGHAVRPAVANMSLGDGGSNAIDDAVRGSINAGISYVVAAGNDHDDACDYSPARVTEAITVGATNSLDARADFSNVGTCLDIFAPGKAIRSAWNSSDSAATKADGTSMAAPHVTGAIALYLSKRPTATTSQVRNSLLFNATSGAVTDRGQDSPNKLLYRVHGPVITSLTCRRNGEVYLCTLNYTPTTSPITIYWYFQGTGFPGGRTITVACSDQSILQVRAVLTDTPTGSRDQAIYNIFCHLEQLRWAPSA
jgi:subtilisin family serine protease